MMQATVRAHSARRLRCQKDEPLAEFLKPSRDCSCMKSARTSCIEDTNTGVRVVRTQA